MINSFTTNFDQFSTRSIDDLRKLQFLQLLAILRTKTMRRTELRNPCRANAASLKQSRRQSTHGTCNSAVSGRPTPSRAAAVSSRRKPRGSLRADSGRAVTAAHVQLGGAWALEPRSTQRASDARDPVQCPGAAWPDLPRNLALPGRQVARDSFKSD